MSHIFISYNRSNHHYARTLADKFLKEGFDVWIDDRIDYGEDWWPIIVRAIRECSAFVVVMTPESDQSRWVQREVTIADELRKPTYPLLLAGDLISSENWMIFVRTQYIDVRDGEMPPDDFYARLAESAPRNDDGGEEVMKQVELLEKPPAQGFHITPPKTVAQPRKPTGILRDVTTVLPQPFDWCKIPDGSVLLKDSSPEGGSHGGDFNVHRYYISKYLITNSQYQAFLDADDGHRNDEWWDYSEDAIIWHKRNRKPRDTAFVGDDLPRTNVSWYDAVAFGQWLTSQIIVLSDRSKVPILITLPTEQQWQRAAQGDDGRVFPWGNMFEKFRCNTPRSRKRMPTPVNHYVDGVSPFGCFDMAGNVWEWCRTEWRTDSHNLEGNRARSVRGGSWDYLQQYSRVDYRKSFAPREQNGFTGFRIVMVAAPNS